MSKGDQCAISGEIIEPCERLRKRIDSINGGAKGLTVWHYSNINTGVDTRTIIGAKTKSDKSGVAFNFCPFCGTKYPYSE